jgi:hypothetical protein
MAAAVAWYETSLLMFEEQAEVPAQGILRFCLGWMEARAGRPDAAQALYLLAQEGIGGAAGKAPYMAGLLHLRWSEICPPEQRVGHREQARTAWLRLERPYLMASAASDEVDPTDLAALMAGA